MEDSSSGCKFLREIRYGLQKAFLRMFNLCSSACRKKSMTIASGAQERCEGWKRVEFLVAKSTPKFSDEVWKSTWGELYIIYFSPDHGMGNRISFSALAVFPYGMTRLPASRYPTPMIPFLCQALRTLTRDKGLK